MLEYGWKRLFSGLLALVLVIGMLPPVAVAAEDTETTEVVEVQETESAETGSVATEAVTEPVGTTETVAETEETVPEATAETTEATEETAAEAPEETEPALPENVAAVQALIDALPDVDSVTAEDYEAVQDAYDAYDALTEEEKTLIQGVEKFEGLFNWFNSQTATLATAASGTCGDNLAWTLDTQGKLTISGTGEMTSYSSIDSVPWHSKRSSITSVLIQQGVTSISPYAFEDCTNLTRATIPQSVTSIGNSAFSCCSSLTSISIPEGITSIGRSVFLLCSSLTSVTIPEGVTSIGAAAFYECSKLTSITIPESVTSIGSGAFYECSSLTDVYYSGTIEKWLQISVDKNNSCLTKGTIHCLEDDGNSLAYIVGTCGDALTWLFADNGTLTIYGTGDMPEYDEFSIPWYSKRSKITNIVIEEGVTSISEYAFYSCHNLAKVTIPDSVASIGKCAFKNCKNLSSITIPNGVDTIEQDTFRDCSKLSSVTIPESVTSIGPAAFSGCDLTSVTIPDSVISIGNNAFSYCDKLSSITIPKNVTTIGEYAFYYCTMTNVTFLSDISVSKIQSARATAMMVVALLIQTNQGGNENERILEHDPADLCRHWWLAGILHGWLRWATVCTGGIVLKALAIFCIPLVFGTDAIWIAPFVAEIITLVIAVVLKKTSKLVYQ